MAKRPRLNFVNRSPIVAVLEPEIQILSAYIDEVNYGCWGVTDSALLREEKSEGWRMGRSETLMVEHNWTSEADIIKALRLPSRRAKALAWDEVGETNQQIADWLGVPLNTVKVWLHRDRLRLAAFRRDLQFQADSEGVG